MNFYDTDTKFNFGRYKGKSLIEVFLLNPSYIDWCLREVSAFAITKESFRRLLRGSDYKFSDEAEDIAFEKISNPDEFHSRNKYSYSDPNDDYEYYQTQISEHPILRNRSDAERLIDEADAIGCDPEDLISNLE